MAHKRHNCSKKDRKGMGACLREIFTASFWKKQHREYAAFEGPRVRWNLPMLLAMGLAMSLECKASMGERFGRAQEWVGAVWPKRKRCGRTLEGYLKALSEVPLKWLGDIRQQMQRHAEECLLRVARVGRFEAYGLDGTTQNLPRTQAHERAYGLATKGPGAPLRMVVAAVALGKEVIWDWASGSAKASERELSLKVVSRLPLGCMVVCDAGFVGYEWCQVVRKSGRHFLLRVGANVHLWVARMGHVEWHDGEVWLWPEEQKKAGAPPLRLRLIRLERQVGTERQEIWLLTDVLEVERLTQREARQLYEKRWPASEGTFRAWKQTLDKAKVSSRTTALTERESELSLLALMLLELMALKARQVTGTKRRSKVSVAQAQQVWRDASCEMRAGKQAKWFQSAMAEAMVDCYRRRKPKVRRPWPQRKQRNLCKGPVLLKLLAAHKRKGLKLLREKKACAS